MKVDYCSDCRWQSHGYCEHPEIGFISGAPKHPFRFTKGICKLCEDIRKDGKKECAGFTSYKGLVAKACHKLIGIRLEGQG